MDYYDIFKKLSKGLVFQDNRNVKTKKKSSQEIEDIEIKVEKSEDCFKNGTLNFGGDTVQDDPLNIMHSVESCSRKSKKRKHGEFDEKKRKMLKVEEINHYRNINGISVVGKHVPEPARSFEDFAIGQDIIRNLKRCGYEEPTPIQKQAVPIMLQCQQILACAPTGSGKTAAFMVPIIHHLKGPEQKGFRALIVCPTRELAKQSQRVCLKLSEGRGFRVHVISKVKKAHEQYGPKSSHKFDILITTPNRICYLLKQDPPAISLANIQWLLIDEADKLFESGKRGFREQLDQILLACTNPERKIAMFSATHTPIVAKWCVHNMKGLVRVTVGLRNGAIDSVEQQLLCVGNEQGKLIGIRDLVRRGMMFPCLIFVDSKERAEMLFKQLIYENIMVDTIHSGKSQAQRDKTVKAFREGQIWALICTELMARGVDFLVNMVINYDFPPSHISYVHRIGRAGRAGRKGKAVTFYTYDDAYNARSVAHIIKNCGYEVPEYLLSLKQPPEMKRASTKHQSKTDKLKKPLKSIKSDIENRKKTKQKCNKKTSKSKANN